MADAIAPFVFLVDLRLRFTIDNPHEVLAVAAHAVELYTRLLEAWNARDADAFASLFTADASVVGFDGSLMNGAAQIASELRAIFAHHQTASYVAKVREVRQLDSRTFLLRAVVGMAPPGKAELNPAVNAIQSLVIVESAAEQKITLLQNTPAAFHGRPQLAENLTHELTDVLRGGNVVVI
jgi:uncharacterized protein (TIGR02246 family)